MKVEFTASAWAEYLSWQETDKRLVRKINELIRDISRDPFAGIGKPEALKHTLAGYWSRRITEEHRLVYKIERGAIVIFQVKYHYR